MEKNSPGLLEEIFLDYKTKMFRYMAQRGVPSFDRDDVFSEVILKTAYKAETFDSAKAALSTWVYIVTRSAIADYFRKRKKDHMPLESLPTIFMYECIDIDLEVELSELEGQLARLPERDRRVIAMRLYDDMEYGEIAMAMNLSVANVKKIYQRALKKLRKMMGY